MPRDAVSRPAVQMGRKAGRSGLLLFGRYAFPPNRLGYCGPDEHEALLAYVAQGKAAPRLAGIERRFEGAYPYLKLIAQANGIADPLDRRVVEAYWIGSRLLDRVDARQFAASLDERSRARMGARAVPWLGGARADGARPHHIFTVFDIYMRTGMLRDARAVVVVKTMDSCRISWGRVVGIHCDELEVERAALVWRDGELALGAPQPVRILRQIDGRGFTGDVSMGDDIAIHWSWACERLSAAAVTRLETATRASMALANAALRESAAP